MRRILFLPILFCSISALSFLGVSSPQEKHLANVQQLTFGGKNAEGYFSADGKKLIFQSTRPVKVGEPYRACYQIYVMDLATRRIDLLSTGKGGTTCSYLLNDNQHFIYSSTHQVSEECPTDPHGTERYQWAVHPFDIFLGSLDGKTELRLTDHSNYDAEATLSPDGETIVFTSLREGDLDLYLMDKTGGNVRRVTSDYGYDGGAFFSPDGKRLVYRASHPQTRDAIDRYRELLSRNLVEPSDMQIFVINADGSGKRQVTNSEGANFAPFYHPDNKRIIYSSNFESFPGQRPSFHLYLIHEDGTGVEKVTTEGGFNSFPMFTRDGRKLVFTSDRNAKEKGEFNLFIADWVP